MTDSDCVVNIVNCENIPTTSVSVRVRWLSVVPESVEPDTVGRDSSFNAIAAAAARWVHRRNERMQIAECTDKPKRTCHTLNRDAV